MFRSYFDHIQVLKYNMENEGGSSCLHRAPMIIKSFIIQLVHNI